MSNDDPFGGADRTIIMPTPGGRGPVGPVPRAAAPMEAAETKAVQSGLNPLVAVANPLLNLVPTIRSSASHPDPEGLRNQLVRSIKEFEERARRTGIAPEKIVAARYLLCTLLDEAVTSTPWGGSGMWARQSLLVTFHNESYGGEKVFQLLAKLAQQPRDNRDVLELIHVVLAFGFEGRYRVLDNGRSQLDSIRERLTQLLRKERGSFERELSPHWQGSGEKRSRLMFSMPLWVVFAVAGALLLGVYLVLLHLLNGYSHPISVAIHQIRVTPLAARAAPPIPASVPPRLAAFLPDDIAQQRLTVRDEPTRSVVIFRGDGLFAPGSAVVLPGFEPVIGRVGRALANLPGRVTIAGHTDDRPIASPRFPSNFHLSQERARAVMNMLAANGVPANRIRAEGRGEAEPIASNSTPENRALNRRVEITLAVATPDNN